MCFYKVYVHNYIGVQKFSKVSVSIAAETIVGIGPFSDIVFAVTLEDGMLYYVEYYCVYIILHTLPLLIY